MSVEIHSPNSDKNDANSSSGSLHGKTWAEEITLSERKAKKSLKNETDVVCGDSVNSSNCSNGSQHEREISVEFLDEVNEEKFKRLCQEEKIKTPFKRQHGRESRSISPNSSNSENGSEYNIYKEEKRLRPNSQASSSSYSYVESDPAVLTRRQKQLDYGKNTVAYERYIEQVPRSDRTPDHPRTPNKYGKYSRRAFDGLVRIWRKQLHHYDAPTEVQDNCAVESSSDESDE